jgi:hypothetical protein
VILLGVALTTGMLKLRPTAPARLDAVEKA